ncbi:MAG: zinc/iron-chelating domain-containing protein [Planctomycetaceae bacterium]|nr:MAG: zinc/iron-chelating domain-containing protein [Planctomycetaceae bacterium]
MKEASPPTDMNDTPTTSAPSSHDVWYAPGLCFSCTQCGNCCTGAPGVVWVSDEELRNIAEFLGESYGTVFHMHTRCVDGRRSLREYPNGDCIYFDGRTRRCKIYPVRPTQCRTWPFWPSHLHSPQTWAEVQQTCPGAGRGTFHSVSEIQHWASLIDL